jgi:hypothetical protein
MTRPELHVIASAAASVGENSVIIEVGSFAGRSAVHWAANSHPTVDIYCIDPFDAVVDDYSFEHIQGDASRVRGRPSRELFVECTRAWAHRVTMVEEASPPQRWNRAAEIIFIDGDHTLEGVTRDLDFWIEYLQPGGRLLGHDWDDGRVREAVEAFAGRRNLSVRVHPGTCVWELSPGG